MTSQVRTIPRSVPLTRSAPKCNWYFPYPITPPFLCKLVHFFYEPSREINKQAKTHRQNEHTVFGTWQMVSLIGCSTSTYNAVVVLQTKPLLSREHYLCEWRWEINFTESFTSWIMSDIPSSSSSASVVTGGSKDRPEPTDWRQNTDETHIAKINVY